VPRATTGEPATVVNWAKNWTEATEPSASAAVAAMVAAVPTEGAPGGVRVMVGDWLAATTMLVAAVRVRLPALSVAMATMP